MKSVVLDAGALIAVERGAEIARIYLALAAKGDVRLITSSAVVAQVWRGGARQARLARLLTSELAEELSLDPDASRRIGVLAAATGAEDVVDGHVALIAEEEDAIVLTGDAEDLRHWGVEPDRVVRV